MKKAAIRAFALSLAVVPLALAPILAFAQAKISLAIPGSYSIATSTPPGYVIANFYQFALSIGGLLAFGAIVYGGVKYVASGGNPSAQSEAKEWIWSALLGLLLLVCAYFVLTAINPNLVHLDLPTLSPVSISQTNVGIGYGGPPSSGGGGGSGGGVGNGTCSPAPAGPCSVSQLQSSCMGSNAQAASEICMKESSGNAAAGGDISTGGQPVSIGLFQINLSVNSIGGLNCPSAFNHSWHAPGVCGKAGTGCGPSTITNQALYAQCVAAAQNVATNIAQACAMSNYGTNWSQWSTHKTCGL